MPRKMEQLVEKAHDVLEEAFQYMLTHDCNLPWDFEARLRIAWARSAKNPLANRDLKDRILDAYKHPRYAYVFARYMETSNPNGVVTEYQRPLAYLYGVKVYSGTKAEEDRKAFWAKWPNEDPASHLES